MNAMTSVQENQTRTHDIKSYELLTVTEPIICKPYVPRAGSPGNRKVPRAASPQYFSVPRAGSPGYIFVLRAGSPVYIFVLRAGSPNVPSCN